MANPALIIRVKTAMDQLSANVAQIKGEIATLGPSFTKAGAAMTAAFTVPIVGALAGAAKAAIDFESSFAGVRKTVEASEPEFAALAAGLRQMAQETPVSVNELNKVAEAAGQLGIKKADILAFTRVMADLGVTTNLTADEAATATARIQNIFGTAGKDVDRFGATLVALGNAGASTEQDIIHMAMRIAGAGNQVGLTQAQVLAFANGLSSVGINAEMGGSAISRVFLKINDAVSGGTETTAEWARVAGVSAERFKTAFETDAAGATVMFIEGLARMKGEGVNVNGVLADLGIKSILMKDTLMRASGAGDLFRESLALGNRAWQENAALTKEAGERYKTVESQLIVLKNKLYDVGITLGQALLPVIIAFVEAATPMVARIASAVEWFGQLPEPVRLVALGFAGLVAAIGPVLLIAGQAVVAFTAVSTILGTAGLAGALTTILPFLGVAGIVAVGIGAWAYALKNADVFLWAAVETWKGLKNAVGTAAGAIVTFAQNIYDGVKGWLVDRFNAVVESIRSKVDAVTGFFASMYDKVVGHSYVPEMVGAIGVAFASLQTVMVEPAVTATIAAAVAFEQLSDGTEVLRTNLRFTAETIEADVTPALEKMKAEIGSVKASMGALSDPMNGAKFNLSGKVNPATGEGMAGTDPGVWASLRQGYTLGEAIALNSGTPTNIGAAHGFWDKTGWHEAGRGSPGMRAMGGPVSAGSPYVVGERGPELFVPNAGGTIVPNGGGGFTWTGDVIVHGSALSSRHELAALVREAMVDFARGQGQRLPSRA